MPSIQEYVELTKLLLGQVGQYFTLSLFVVLANRLWRRQLKLSSGKKVGNFILAALISAAGVWHRL
jgi:hypothetical protein